MSPLIHNQIWSSFPFLQVSHALSIGFIYYNPTSLFLATLCKTLCANPFTTRSDCALVHVSVNIIMSWLWNIALVSEECNLFTNLLTKHCTFNKANLICTFLQLFYFPLVCVWHGWFCSWISRWLPSVCVFIICSSSIGWLALFTFNDDLCVIARLPGRGLATGFIFGDTLFFRIRMRGRFVYFSFWCWFILFCLCVWNMF